jgi:hypothetical protein
MAYCYLDCSCCDRLAGEKLSGVGYGQVKVDVT